VLPELLLYTGDLALTRDEIARAGGRVLLVLTPSVIVASVPEDTALRTCSTARPGGLDPTSIRASDAWLARRLKGEPEPGIPWDTPGYEPPE
jgi:hypothetical protein